MQTNYESGVEFLCSVEKCDNPGTIMCNAQVRKFRGCGRLVCLDHMQQIKERVMPIAMTNAYATHVIANEVRYFSCDNKQCFDNLNREVN